MSDAGEGLMDRAQMFANFDASLSVGVKVVPHGGEVSWHSASHQKFPRELELEAVEVFEEIERCKYNSLPSRERVLDFGLSVPCCLEAFMVAQPAVQIRIK